MSSHHPAAARSASPEPSEGVNLRKEAEKIDIKQFNPNDVAQVIPIMAVMRPPEGLREKSGGSKSSNKKRQPLLQGK